MATSAYLKIEGVTGESLVKGHEGDIELQDWAWDTVQALNIGSQASGAGAGKITFNPLTIKKYIDKTSPLLFAFEASGKAFAARLSLARSIGVDSATTDFLKIEMGVCAVKAISLTGADMPLETIQFEFGQVRMIYTPVSSDGKKQAEVINGWDRIRNIQMATAITIK